MRAVAAEVDIGVELKLAVLIKFFSVKITCNFSGGAKVFVSANITCNFSKVPF